MLSLTTLLTLLPFLASATPVLTGRAPASISASPGPIVLHAEGKASGTPIEDKDISALNGTFFINHPTVADACPDAANCTLPTNLTAMFVLQDGTARLASKGSPQQIYVNGSNGALSYEPAHGTNAHFPHTTSNGTAVDGNDLGVQFAYSPQTASGPGRLTFNGAYEGDESRDWTAFWACPTGGHFSSDAVYQIFVASNSAERGQCVGIEIFGMEYTKGLYTAWAY